MTKASLKIPRHNSSGTNLKAELQFQFAWEHFKFHAEQRTRTFHFFLIATGLIMGAVSFIIKAEAKFHDLAVFALCFSGVISTFFLSLDIRNTQLLEQSEDILREIEQAYLYDGWTAKSDEGTIALGILSREAVLKNWINSWPSIGCPCIKTLFVDNIKHKTAFRGIILLVIAGSWLGAWKIANTLTALPNLAFWTFIFAVLSVSWALYSLWTPIRDRAREVKAYAAKSG